MTAFKNKIILQILSKYKDIWALGYASAVAYWDLDTYMPEKGARARGEALGRLSTIRQKLFLDKSFVSLINQAERSKTLSEVERGVVRVLTHDLKYYEKLPAKFLEDFSRLTSEATVIWREAKNKNNFKLFEPYLSKIFTMNRQMAGYLGYKNSPYDALLDLFEEGLTSREVESFFGEIKTPLSELLAQAMKLNKNRKSHSLEGQAYNQEKLKRLNQKILSLFWSDMSRFRLDTSGHPFTISFSNTDTRITTYYHKTNFGRSLLAMVHEFGHALYDLQSADDLQMTPIGSGNSIVIHESQSRLWENFVGRGRPFIKHFLKGMEQAVGRKLSVAEVYSYFNKVEPGLLRIEADEITYHFHIMLRYEIEKGLIEGKLRVKDLPEIWNAKMKEYLGIVPKRDSDGVLQDIHWSGGMVGYFPTYSLGTFLSAQWEKQMGIADSMSCVGRKEKWLKEHIHKYGSTYTLKELLAKNKMKFDPAVNLDYLRKKYSKVQNDY